MNTIDKIENYLNEGILSEKESKEDKIKKIKGAIETYKQLAKKKGVDPQQMLGAFFKEVERITK